MSRVVASKPGLAGQRLVLAAHSPKLSKRTGRARKDAASLVQTKHKRYEAWFCGHILETGYSWRIAFAVVRFMDAPRSMAVWAVLSHILQVYGWDSGTTRPGSVVGRTEPVLNDHEPRALRLNDWIEDKPLMGPEVWSTACPD